MKYNRFTIGKFHINISHYLLWSKEYDYHKIYITPSISIAFCSTNYSYITKIDIQFLTYNLVINFSKDKVK